MIIKPFPETAPHIKDLQKLLECAPANKRNDIRNEIRTARAGYKTEKETAYLLDFDFQNSQNIIVLHDLRLEINGRVAQIDHLIINRMLEVFVLESKTAGGRLKISKDGQFSRFNTFTEKNEVLRSPITQNKRHIAVLRDAFDSIDMPIRVGMRLKPQFIPIVLLHPKTMFALEDQKLSDTVMYSDSFNVYYEKRLSSVKTAIGDVIRGFNLIASDTLIEIGQQIAALHSPITFDWAARFGLKEIIDEGDITDENRHEEKTEVTAGHCHQCQAAVDKKVVNFCRRFNKKRFGGKVYCRDCQESYAAI